MRATIALAQMYVEACESEHGRAYRASFPETWAISYTLARAVVALGQQDDPESAMVDLKAIEAESTQMLKDRSDIPIHPLLPGVH